MRSLRFAESVARLAGEAQSIMQASLLVSMETIQVRLRSELFGLYQFRAHLVSPSYPDVFLRRSLTPTTTATTCAAVVVSTSILCSPFYPPLPRLQAGSSAQSNNRARARARCLLAEEPKDLGKHGYRIEQRHFATGGKSHGNLRADVYTSKRKLRRFLSPERKNPISNFDLR